MKTRNRALLLAVAAIFGPEAVAQSGDPEAACLAPPCAPPAMDSLMKEEIAYREELQELEHKHNIATRRADIAEQHARERKAESEGRSQPSENNEPDTGFPEFGSGRPQSGFPFPGSSSGPSETIARTSSSDFVVLGVANDRAVVQYDGLTRSVTQGERGPFGIVESVSFQGVAIRENGTVKHYQVNW